MLNNCKQILMSGLLAVFSLTALTAQTDLYTDTVSLSMEQAVNYAMENSTAMKNAALDVRKQKWFTVEILTEGLPKINAGLNYQNNFELPVNIIPAGTFGNPEDIEAVFGVQQNMTADVTVDQLFLDGRYFIGLKSNKAFMAVAETQRELTEIEVRQSVEAAYYAALTAAEAERLVTKSLATVEKLLYETEKLYEEGFTEELDVDRLQLSLNNLKSSMEDAKREKALTVAVLKYQIGMPMEQSLQLTDELEESLLENLDAGDEDEFDFTQRTEYKLLTINNEIRKYDVQQTRAAYFPALYGYFGYGYNAQREEFNFLDSNEPWFRNGKVGLQLNVPIFDSYKTGAQVQQKKVERLKALNDYYNFENQAKLEVQTARNDYKKAVLNYNNQKQSLNLAEKIFNKVTIKNREGLASSLELADAEASLNETQSNYISSVYNLLVSKTKLDKALGKY